MVNFIVSNVVSWLWTIIFVLLSVAWLTVLERVVLSGVQRRVGPRVVGMYGLFQAVADGIKLLTKSVLGTVGSWSGLFYLAPILVFTSGFAGWSLLPTESVSAHLSLENGIGFWLLIIGLSVYGVLLAGWSSDSQYGFLGGVRSAAQMLGYEIGLGLIFLIVCFVSSSLDLESIAAQHVEFGVGVELTAFGLWLVCLIAELNRHPFDLPEAESELVSGYNVEYSGSGFVLFFLGEYSSMFQGSALTWVLFGGLGSLEMMVFILVFVMVLLRSALPRYRFDQLLSIGWYSMLPLGYSFLCMVLGLIICGN